MMWYVNASFRQGAVRLKESMMNALLHWFCKNWSSLYKKRENNWCNERRQGAQLGETSSVHKLLSITFNDFSVSFHRPYQNWTFAAKGFFCFCFHDWPTLSERSPEPWSSPSICLSHLCLYALGYVFTLMFLRWDDSESLLHHLQSHFLYSPLAFCNFPTRIQPVFVLVPLPIQAGRTGTSMTSKCVDCHRVYTVLA